MTKKAIEDKLTVRDLIREIDDFRERWPKLRDDQLFMLWFLRAYVTEDEHTALSALCGGSKDKQTDAVVIDDQTRNVFIVQSKYHKRLGAGSEKYPDVTGFARLAQILSGENDQFSEYVKDLAPEVKARLSQSRGRVLKNGYKLKLYYVTTGKCSKSLKIEAAWIAKKSECRAVMEVFDWRHVLSILDYYLRDVAPPIPSLDLEMERGGGVEVKGIFHRYDTNLDIESWVFSMSRHCIAEMYAQAGRRLFALNIRGYQGDTEINKGMATTLKEEPEHFWYYNNGLTVVCDHAEEISAHGIDILRVSNPQIINGQQTTLTLTKTDGKSGKASVTVRVIRLPHDVEGDVGQFDALISAIVKATNWQNYIVPSDLISNNRRQIELHRQLRKLGYWYVRKRQPRSEARKEAGAQHYYMIYKTELAQAVAGCDLDPAIVREGKEKLFEDKLYHTVFPTTEPYYYLTRYWLMCTVGAAASGYPERAYAKWLVLNFVWSRIRSIVQSRSKAERFRHEWEGADKGLDYLWGMNNAAFGAALQFFRKKRGKGMKARDVSSFFKRRNLHSQFEKFWHGSNNSYRMAFQRNLKEFERLLSEEK